VAVRAGYKLLLLSALAGLCAWIADATVAAFVFGEGTWTDLLILNVPARQWYARSVVLAGFLLGGLGLGAYVSRRTADLGRLRRLDSVVQAVTSIGSLIIRETDRDKLIRQACRQLVRNGAYRSAWIALTDASGAFVGAAEAGLGKTFASLLARVRRDDWPACWRKALERPGATVVADPASACPDCPVARTHDRRQCLSVRLEHAGQIHGLMVASPPAGLGRVGGGERSIFEDIGGYLAFAIHNIAESEKREGAERALRAAESEKADIVDSMSEHVVRHDTNLVIQWANRAAAESVGLAPESLRGRRCYELWQQRDTPCEGCPVAESMHTGRPEQAEMTSPGGRTWLVRGSPIRGSDGRIVGAVEITLEITGRKKAERRVRSLAKFPEENPNPVLRVSREGTILYANAASSRLLSDWRRQVKHALPEDLHRLVVDALDADKGREVEVAMGEKTCSLVFAPVVEAGYVNVYGADVTERRRAEEDLRVQRDFAESMVETAPAIVLMLDGQGRILRFNRFAQELTGYAEEEVRGRNWFETFLPAEQRGRVGEVFLAILRGDTARGVENPILAKDGREVLVRWYNLVLRGARGEPTGVLAIGHDITEIREKEQQLRRAVTMEAIGRMAGGIAHDFNNTLAIVKGYADLLAKSLPAADERRDDLDRIIRAADRAAGLTRQLLALGREQVVRPRVVQLAEVIAAMDSMLRRTIGDDVELAAVAPEGLWNVRVDPTQIQQVILNLAVNAREAMPEGGRLTIETSNVVVDGEHSDEHAGCPPGEYVLLAVRDTGVGMSPEVASHVFEPFFSTKAKSMGSGLGLSTSYGIVKQSGGHILVDTAPGAGTTFRIYLPRVGAPRDRLPEVMAAQTPEKQIPRGTETVLVVEDKSDVRKLACRVLGQLGYQVLSASNAEEALDIGAKRGDRRIDLLLTDVVMPRTSGKRLADRLRGLCPDIAVLFFSGYAGDALIQRGALAEGMNFLPKPFSGRQLAEAVRRVLDAEKPRRAR